MTSNNDSDPAYAIYSQVFDNNNVLENTGVNISDEAVKKISLAVTKSLEPVFFRLTSEILCLRDEVKQLKKNHKIPDILPRNPFKNYDDFDRFETLLKDDSNAMTALENNLKHISNNGGRFVKNCWRKILTDNLAEKYSWKGTANKKNIQSFNITVAIKNAAEKRGLDEGHFAQETKSFFQFAKNRQKQRAEYKSKTMASNSE